MYHHTNDADFGAKTRAAVLEFQRRYFVDGICNHDTWKAIEEAVAAWANRDLNILVTVPKGLQELEDVFGHIEFEEAGNGNIIITNDWEKDNVVLVELPVVGKHYVHQKLVQVFESVLDELKAKGLDGEIHQFGTWCPRHKGHDSGRSLSTHSWGIACDLNAATNPYGAPGDMDPDIVTVFERHGFEWGGRWSGKYLDCMHFQYVTGY